MDQFLRQVIEPSSWDETGASGTTRFYRGLLVVQQKASTHRSLTRLLTALEEHCLRSQQESGGSSVIVVEGSPEQQRIEQLLRQAVKIDFCGEPLDRALARLALDHDLPLVFDEDLELAWSEIDWPPLTFSSARYTLGGVLDRMLKAQWLNYEVQDGALFVTRRTDPAARMEVRLYRTADLPSATLPEDLIAAIKPELWDRGDFFETRLLRTGWLIVATDWPRHQRVADWFGLQRTGRKPRSTTEREELAVEMPFDPFAVPGGRLQPESALESLEVNP